MTGPGGGQRVAAGNLRADCVCPPSASLTVGRPEPLTKKAAWRRGRTPKDSTARHENTLGFLKTNGDSWQVDSSMIITVKYDVSTNSGIVERCELICGTPLAPTE